MTTTEKFSRLRWPAALVLTAMVLGSVAVYVLVPEEERSLTLIAWGTLCGVFLAFLKPMLVRLLPLAFVFVAGCGASGAVRSAYALEQARCLANERQIIDRESSEAEDDRDMAAERARCDAALLAIGGE